MEDFPPPIRTPEVKYTQIFINNEFVNSASGKVFPTINPCTGEKIIDIQEGDKADVDKAVAAAKDAFKFGSPWRRMDAGQRGKLLSKFASLLERDVQYIASLETLDNGKPYMQAMLEVYFSSDVTTYYAGWADKINETTIPANGDYMCYTKHEPVGICGQLIPWNYPVSMFVWKIAQALAAGCVIVAKPAEQTPLTALYCSALLKEAGFPPGVINVVPGYESTVGAAISNHLDINKVDSIESIEVGQIVMQAAGASNIKRTTTTLGGKSPNVIFEDADLDTAVGAAQEAVMTNAGQCCVAGGRIFVHESIYDAFVSKTVEKAVTKKVGDPYEKETVQGPQVDEEQFNRILSLIESGKKEGATLNCGGSKISDKGYFIQPTVFSDVQNHMKIAKEEICGPVQQIFKFKDIDELLEIINNTTYGLGAAVFTKDINKALLFAQGVLAGTVWIYCYNVVNTQSPFGGFKMSGLGTKLGRNGVDNYLKVKKVIVKIPQTISELETNTTAQNLILNNT